MQDILVVVDMQKDFIDGSLGTPEARAILPKVREAIASFTGKVFYTRDTHGPDYLSTEEGRNLPVEHCRRGTPGWEIAAELEGLPCAGVIDKPTFGSLEVAERLRREDREERVASVTLIGLCTDICVISNALLAKAALPEAEIAVKADCCAGVTPASHERALEAMRACQIVIR